MYGGAIDPKVLFRQYSTALIDRLHGDNTFTDSGEISEIPPAFFESDPSRAKHLYLEWLVRSYIRGGIPKYSDLISRALPALIKFGRIKDKLSLGDNEAHRKPWTNMRDIKNYCGLVGCTATIKDSEYNVPGLEDIMMRHPEIRKQRQKYDRLVFESDEIRVYNPLTVEESCHYGRGTTWCTAARTDNKFEFYKSEGSLYIVVPKSPTYHGEKYQLHPLVAEYTDEKNQNISLADLFKKYPSIATFLIKDIDSIINLCSIYESAENVAKIIVYVLQNNIIDIPILLNDVMPYITHSHTDINADEQVWINYYSHGGFNRYSNYQDIILGINRGNLSKETRQQILSILSGDYA